MRWNAVCIDCHPSELAAVVGFYVGLLDLEAVDREERWAALRDPAGGMGINVQAEDGYVRPVWPDSAPGQTKMMHFEVRVDDVASAVVLAVGLGGQQADLQPPDRDPAALRVMLDPAGHPFCLWS